MRRSARRVFPARDRWHSLQEYAVGETSQEEFRLLRARDAAVAASVAKSEAPRKTIDWAAWESKIGNKETFQCLKDFHSQQSAMIDAVLKEDHVGALKSQTQGWELFADAQDSCAKSVEKSQQILQNGARALWISFQNPPVSQLSQSEWLDVDQYWQAFVEKHHYYHNHIASAVEDPESKEYDAKQKADLLKRWETFDGRGTTRQNNKLLYQRPSYEYYDVYRGPLIEHMIFYLTKTGGDARTFPETMPVQWFAEIYDMRFKLYNVLQRRKRIAHEAKMSRVETHDFHPENIDEDGDVYYAKLIARESAITDLTVGRLMGNYILFSDAYIPVQTGQAFYKAVQADGGKGTFYSLGSDVHCLFYKPAGDDLHMPDPKECFHSLANHVSMTGRRFDVGYASALDVFTDVLESRKEGLGGSWFTAPGESSSDAFMRRVKRSDPAYAIYEAYAAEHAEKWASAKTLSIQEAIAEMPEIERKYQLECREYDNILFGLSDEFGVDSKAQHEHFAKLGEVETLQANLDACDYVAHDGFKIVTNAGELTESIKAFESNRDKCVDSVLSVKIAALDKKK